MESQEPLVSTVYLLTQDTVCPAVHSVAASRSLEYIAVIRGIRTISISSITHTHTEHDIIYQCSTYTRTPSVRQIL